MVKIQKKNTTFRHDITFDIHDTVINQKKDKYLLSAIKLYQYYSTQVVCLINSLM